MPWFASLRDTAKAGLTLDRALSDPRRAVRGALAVAIVVFPVLALAGPALATSAAMGAFIAGTATFQRSFRPRTSLAVGAGIGLGLSTFLGYLAVGVPGVFPVLLALWAFGAGMAWAVGPTGGVVAATTVSVMLVVVQLPVSVGTALGHGLLCALGGAVQALVVTLWPIDSWGAQRAALADTYAALADYARRLRQDPMAQVDPEPFFLARQAAQLTPWQQRRRPAGLRGLRGLAEKVRPAMAALADPRVGAPAEGPARDRAREILAAAAEVLDALARAIRSGDSYRPPRSTPSLALFKPDDRPALSGAARRSARRLSGLLSRAVDSLDKQDQSTISGPATGPGLHRPPLLRVLPSALRTVRRQMDPHAAVFQHAVRLSSVVTGSYVVARLLGVRHGYWAPMTAAMVMRPDFAQTYSRGVARLAGTVAGVALATLVVRLFDPGEWLSAALAVVFIAGAYLTMRTGYALTTTCMSGYVVFLLGLEDVDPTQTAVDRVAMTLLGGAVALGAYALFPTWHTARLPERLAEYLAAAGRYATAVVNALGAPGERNARAVTETLLDLRETRSEMLQAQERADAEPHRDPDRLTELPRKQLDRARAAVALLSRGAMLMEAHLPPADSPPLPGTAEFAEELRDATAIAAAAVLLGQPPDFSGLRAAHERWDAQLAALPTDSGAEDRGGVARSGARLLMQALADLEKAVRPRRPAEPARPVPSEA
ncbi:FUSC family protein [Kitasatospora sp. NPDC088346]|uniref:FUSC family protein n=1 Tax=Kitasatospora sp. NPDC088346 TaxID=3364073 RepID=UPI003804922E